MISAMICLTAAAAGIEFGWQPLPEGGMEYIIQLPPEARELLRSGQMLRSEVPLNVKEVRAFRIIVGREKLPRIDAPITPAAEKRKPAAGPTLTNASGTPYAPTAHKTFSREQDTDRADGTRSVSASPAQKQSSPSSAPLSTVKSKPPTESGRPWLPLAVACLACFALLAALVYLLWIHLELRGRYRKLLESSLAAR